MIIGYTRYTALLISFACQIEFVRFVTHILKIITRHASFMKSSLVSVIIILLVSVTLGAQPRPAKLSSTIVIDTDCGIDDMRAISYLLARPEITVKAILTSDGSLPPGEGADKVLSLLNEFNRTDIPVLCGSVLPGVNPVWRSFNSGVLWGGKSEGRKTNVVAADYLQKVLSDNNEKTTIVCLGPLTNIYEAVKKDASFLQKADRVIWYNDSANPLTGFNYECDKESADAMLKLKVRIDIISNLDMRNSLFDISLADVCSQSNTLLAHVLNRVLIQQTVSERLKENHFRLCDDLVALYITNPELFDINTNMDKPNIRFNTGYDTEGVKEAIADMIKGTYVTDRNVVFNRFPDKREMFDYDIRPIIDSAISRYGHDEWKANVMTDEFHGHLGVFSIVGAKMGIKAREIFGVGPDMLDVVTYAGTTPPYSCLTDGIQVSTGATLGMGTIHLAKNRKPEPSAVFTYKSRSIRITLKKEYLDKVDADIKEGIIKFGLMDDGYWKLIRHNALKYWVEWDRNKIFEVEEIDIKK
jgi:inosine-uridine nucleoside N-ribohydrolase/formylmethanofuran dehydrogenase subunit E